MKYFNKSFIISLLFILTLSQSNLSTQVKNYQTQFKTSYDAFFYQDFVNTKSNKQGLTKINIYIHVPYKSLRFIKTGQGFTAKYSVSISVYDKNKENLQVEKFWSETINVMDFSQTTSKLNFNVGLKSIELKPAKYLFQTIVTDNETKKEIKTENIFDVREFNQNLDISDILFVKKLEHSSSKVLPNISRDVTVAKDGLQFYYDLFSGIEGIQNCFIEYEIFDKENKIVFQRTFTKELTPGKNQILENITDLKLNLGIYTLRLTLKDEKFKTINVLNKTFFSRWIGIPSVISDLDKAINQMVYIATPKELNDLKEATTIEEKTQKFLEFWKRKDPSPANEENEVFEEYFRRIQFSEENFSNYIEGWRSDRGMVYIILGPPNNINRYPFEYHSKPYEVWEYYQLNRSFVFVDQTGFGDYRLITPLSGDLFRYRY